MLPSIDADHAWNTAVKGYADQLLIAKAVQSQLISNEFVLAVLPVDFTRPVFSPTRCSLLQALRDTWSPDWQAHFQENLSMNPSSGAQQLLKLLTSDQTLSHQQQSIDFLQSCQKTLRSPEKFDRLVGYLGQSRAEIRASEISKNPRGQILEPGFRVIAG